MDAVTEQVVLAAALADDEQRDQLLTRLRPEQFNQREHQQVWRALGEMKRLKLGHDPATVQRLDPQVDLAYLEALQAARPEQPPNLQFHVEQLLWDHARVTAVNGPIAGLLQGLRDARTEPARVKSLARQVQQAFDGYQDRAHLHDPAQLVREQVMEIRQRMAGLACYPYGVPGLDADAEGQHRMVPGAKPGMVTVISGISGAGKALALDTPVPTPHGWSTMLDLEPGDEVFDEQGRPCHVVWATPVMLGRTCYEVEFSDGTIIVADAEHQWVTMTAAERRAAVHRTDAYRAKRRLKRGLKRMAWKTAVALDPQRFNESARVSKVGSIRTTEQIAASLQCQATRVGSLNHSVTNTAPLQLPRKDLSVDPYVLGVWLGDGTSAAGQITSADLQIMSEVQDRGYEVRSLQTLYSWGVSGLQVQLRDLGVLGNKHIPDHYLRASFHQRLDLMRGLMDTDGYCKAGGSNCEFTTTSPSLRDGIGELAASLGIKVRCIEGVAKLRGRVIGPKWRFHFTTDLPVFLLRRKRELQERVSKRGAHLRNDKRYITDVRRVTSVPVRCIAVDSPSCMFLAGRAMVPTHNSTLCAHIMLGLARQRRRVLCGAWEMTGGVTLELLACLSLGFSRTALMTGRVTEEELQQIEQRMLQIGRYVKFMANPFRRQQKEGKASNERNLDIIQGYIADTGCDVFIADLWRRCLKDDDPGEEEFALYRQQSMAEEMRVHCILVQQQRLKDVEQRPDKRPTREGIKGTSAWVEVADTILATNRPALWKNLDDNLLECFPANTLVDRRPIESWQPGEMVWSYDPAGRRLARRRVLAVSRRSVVWPLVRVVFEGGREVTCTPEHPFLTVEGWVPACTLEGMHVLKHSDADLPDLWEDFQTNQEPGQQSEVLWGSDRLLDGVPPSQAVGRRGAAPGLSPHEGAQPDVRPGGTGPCSSRQGDQRDRTRAGQASDLRVRTNVPTSDAAQLPWCWVGHGAQGVDERGGGEDVRCPPSVLSNRHCRTGDEGGGRSRRLLPLQPEGSGSIEGHVLGWARVDRVEVLQPRSTGGREHVCPGGLVYNLQVEEHETYLVGGVVVHNCHILKQRYGKWPQLVEFDWSPEHGSIKNGRTVAYEHAVQGGQDDGPFSSPNRGGPGRKRR